MNKQIRKSILIGLTILAIAAISHFANADDTWDKLYLETEVIQMSADEMKIRPTLGLVGGFEVTSNLALEFASYVPTKITTTFYDKLKVDGDIRMSRIGLRYDFPASKGLLLGAEFGIMEIDIYDIEANFEVNVLGNIYNLKFDVEDDYLEIGPYLGWGLTYKGVMYKYRINTCVETLSANLTHRF